MKVLSLNLGSSSLKYAVHDGSGDAMEAIVARTLPTAAHPEAASDAARRAIDEVRATIGHVDAVGHRVVFGGDDDTPSEVTADVLARLDDLQSLDPLHAPGALAVIREALAAIPEAVHVACFDTAFFRDIPRTARALPIPTRDPLLRRFGFHGLSYEYVCRSLAGDLMQRTIVAHLGNGASVVALSNGQPIDMTMGFSPLSGVIMSTRPGDLDPGVLLYLLERSAQSPSELRKMLETDSGLQALSGVSGDLQTLSRSSDENAAFAVEMFVRYVAKAIGALATELGGLDMLAFTGGIGEHNDAVRAAICNRVRFLNPNVVVRVVNGDENVMIALHTVGVIESERAARR